MSHWRDKRKKARRIRIEQGEAKDNSVHAQFSRDAKDDEPQRVNTKDIKQAVTHLVTAKKAGDYDSVLYIGGELLKLLKKQKKWITYSEGQEKIAEKINKTYAEMLFAANHKGDWAAVESIAKDRLQSNSGLENIEAEAFSHNYLSLALAKQDKWEELEPVAEKFLELSTELGDDLMKKYAYVRLVQSYMNQDKWQEALDKSQERLEFEKQSLDLYVSSHTYSLICSACNNLGKFDKMEEMAREWWDSFKDHKDLNAAYACHALLTALSCQGQKKQEFDELSGAYESLVNELPDGRNPGEVPAWNKPDEKVSIDRPPELMYESPVTNEAMQRSFDLWD